MLLMRLPVIITVLQHMTRITRRVPALVLWRQRVVIAQVKFREICIFKVLDLYLGVLIILLRLVELLIAVSLRLSLNRLASVVTIAFKSLSGLVMVG